MWVQRQEQQPVSVSIDHQTGRSWEERSRREEMSEWQKTAVWHDHWMMWPIYTQSTNTECAAIQHAPWSTRHNKRVPTHSYKSRTQGISSSLLKKTKVFLANHSCKTKPHWSPLQDENTVFLAFHSNKVRQHCFWLVSIQDKITLFLRLLKDNTWLYSWSRALIEHTLCKYRV